MGVQLTGIYREDANVFLANGVLPLPKAGGFDEHGEDDGGTFCSQIQGVCSSGS